MGAPTRGSWTAAALTAALGLGQAWWALGGDHVATADSQQVCVGGPVVTSVDGRPVEDAADLQEAVDASTPGASITLGLTDPDGSTRTLRVTLGTRPASTSSTQDATCG